MRKLALLFAVSFVAAGCGDDSSGGGGGGGGGASPTGPACLIAGDACFVASGVTFTGTDLTNLQTACQMGYGGTFSSSGTCSTAATVTGYCQFPDTSASGVTVAGATMRGYYYTAAGWTAPTAGMDCSSGGGTWVGAGGGGATVTIRCAFSSAATCDQLTGAMNATDLSALSASCAGYGGTYAVGSCSTASAVSGHCAGTGTAPSGAPITVATFYYTPTWNGTTAAADCGAPLVP